MVKDDSEKSPNILCIPVTGQCSVNMKKHNQHQETLKLFQKKKIKKLNLMITSALTSWGDLCGMVMTNSCGLMMLSNSTGYMRLGQ